MVMLNELFRKVHIVAVIPFIVWAFGTTIYLAMWKAEVDYKVNLIMVAVDELKEQSSRVTAIEQRLIYVVEAMRDMKEVLKEETKND